MNKKSLSIIAAVSANGIIGSGDSLPWHQSNDLKYFKKKTFGHALIVGRKTYESLPRALENRILVVMSRSKPELRANTLWAQDWDKALQIAYGIDSEPLVIGGAEIYKMASEEASRLYVTKIHADVTGDTRWPIDMSSWKEYAKTQTVKADEMNQYDYSIHSYEKMTIDA